LAVPEFIDIAAMGLDMVADLGGGYDAALQAITAEWLLEQLVAPDPRPAPRAVPGVPLRRLATKAHKYSALHLARLMASCRHSNRCSISNYQQCGFVRNYDENDHSLLLRVVVGKTKALLQRTRLSPEVAVFCAAGGASVVVERCNSRLGRLIAIVAKNACIALTHCGRSHERSTNARRTKSAGR
jgi:hypothetical protein